MEATHRREQFDRDGFLHVRGFASREECAALKTRMQELIAAWDPMDQSLQVFRTDDNNEGVGKSDYFLDSADRIHFFTEAGAMEEDGSIKTAIPKARALNKVGHALHSKDAVFQRYSHSDKVQRLVAELGWQDPVLPQSMYIFKQPQIGGEVTAHQDSTFLHTTPRETCLGLWLALDEATLENGCLWARRGSHVEPVRRVFMRNPVHFSGEDASAPQMIFENRDPSSEAFQWEGKMPPGSAPPSSQGLHDRGFEPVECAVGDLVVIHGQVDHLSLANVSEKPRETYQLHLVEGPARDITWSPTNWLQYPPGKAFPPLQTGALAAEQAA